MMQLWRALALGCLAVMVAAAAPAERVAVRYGDHPGFGRVVFDVGNGEQIGVSQSGDSVDIALPGGAVQPVGHLPHNVVGISFEADHIRLTLKPGAVLQHRVLNHHLVLDALDPVPHPALPPPVAAPVAPSVAPPVASPTGSAPRSGSAQASPPAKAVGRNAGGSQPPPMTVPQAQTTSMPSGQAAPAQGGASASVATDAALSSPVALSPQATPAPVVGPVVAPVVASSKAMPSLSAPGDPVALVADARTVPDAGPGHMLLLPFAPAVGAAAFRRGDDILLVFDERKPIDLQPVQADPVFGHAVVQLLPDATVLRMRLPGAAIRLERRKGGWIATALGGDAAPPALRQITPMAAADRVLLPAAGPGVVVSVPDPQSGEVLLVGTQRDVGEGVAVARHTPDFALLPSWQGVVLLPLSDAISLRATEEGFQIRAELAGGHLVGSPPQPEAQSAAEASRLTRIFDLPRLRTDALIRRLQGAIQSAAATPAQSRLQARKAVAASMVALGLGQEAQSVLTLATNEDASGQDDPQLGGLSAVASLLAFRPQEASGLDDRRLDGSDEIAFWRAVRTAMQREVSPEAAAVFANTAGLLADYPPELHALVAPLVAETMAMGGQTEAARALLDRDPDDHSLDLARAMLAEATGKVDDAMARYDALSHSADRLVRLRALRNGQELRLATGHATPAETAEQLGRALYAWRGDDREVELRLRVAQLEGQANAWRPALQLLRETEALWPEKREQLRARLHETISQALTPTGQASLKPFDLVALAEENADILPDGEAGLALADKISQQFLALDLPERAMPFLQKMCAEAPSGAARASFGARLAQLQLERGERAAVLATLTQTAADDMPQPLLETRTLLFARAIAGHGDYPSARHALQELDSIEGYRLLGELAEGGANWPDATAALRQVVQRSLPEQGGLTDDQAALVLRLASAASQAGDDASLRRIRTDLLQRIPAGPSADSIRLLTAPKLAAVADMAGLSGDLAAARALLAPPAKPPATPVAAK